MVTKIWLHEYGPFREAELSLAPLTVLVGPNASGKTMAMEALARVEEAIRVAASALFPDPESVPYDDEALENTTRAFFKLLGRRGSSGRDSLVEFEVNGTRYSFGVTDSPGEPTWTSRLPGPRAFPPMRSLKFEPAALRRASYLEADELVIQPDGYGLATVLADMKLQDDERLEWILAQVRKIIPGFAGVRFHRARVQRGAESITGQELIFDTQAAQSLPPALVSDGTILVLGIVTSIASMPPQSERPILSLLPGSPTRYRTSLILIDDLERGLHPRALKDFIGCLRRMTEEMPVQILATSHSPYLLDWLHPEEVRLTSFLKDGSATICELSDHPEFERWKDVMTPGEFWATAGEDWVRNAKG